MSMYTSMIVVCACACVCFYLLLCILASQHLVYGHSHCFQDPWVPFHEPSTTSNCLRITALLRRRLRMRTLNSHRILDSPLMRISLPHIFRQPSATFRAASKSGSMPLHKVNLQVLDLLNLLVNSFRWILPQASAQLPHCFRDAGKWHMNLNLKIHCFHFSVFA